LQGVVPALVGIAVIALIIVMSLIALRRVRWQRKPHLGHWKEWDD
jgi:hypothetical protein